MRLPHLPDDPEARSLWRVSRILWACVAVIAAWGLFRASGADGPPLPYPGWFALIVALEAVNLGVRTVVALRRTRGRAVDRRVGWTFTCFDLLFITLGLRLTGGAQSPFWVVLFVVTVAETILAPRSEAYLVRWGAGVALLAGTWSPDVPADLYWLDFGTRLFFLTAVSMITRRIRLNAAEKEQELANLRADLALAGERARLAREVHDGVGNALAATVLRLEVAARVAAKRPDAAEETFKDEAQALRAAMDTVRDWTFFTRPWPTGTAADEAFSEVLTREIDRLSRRTGLPVTVEGASRLDEIGQPARVAALRIAQEALTNAAKHACATRALVSLRRNGRLVELSVADDGRGFDAGAAGCGVGLASMRERTEALGGTLRVDSAPGLGTTVTVGLPAGEGSPPTRP